jgi:hypothetical protein
MQNNILNQIVQVELQLIEIKKKVRAIETMVAALDPNLAKNLSDVNRAIYKSEIALSSISQSPSASDIPMLYDDYLEILNQTKAAAAAGKSLTADNKTFVSAPGAR